VLVSFINSVIGPSEGHKEPDPASKEKDSDCKSSQHLWLA